MSPHVWGYITINSQTGCSGLSSSTCNVWKGGSAYDLLRPHPIVLSYQESHLWCCKAAACPDLLLPFPPHRYRSTWSTRVEGSELPTKPNSAGNKNTICKNIRDPSPLLQEMEPGSAGVQRLPPLAPMTSEMTSICLPSGLVDKWKKNHINQQS